MNTDYLFERGKIANIMGVNKNAIDFGKMDEKSKKSVYNGIKKVFAQFPELRGYTNKVLYDPDIKGYAMSKSMQGVLKIGSKFSNYKELKRRYDRDVRMQFHPAGTNADAIIIHEMGHQLDILKWNGTQGRDQRIRYGRAECGVNSNCMMSVDSVQ